MAEYFRAGVVVWVCRLAFLGLVYLLDLTALDNFLAISLFFVVDLSLSMKIARLKGESNYMSAWRQASYEDAFPVKTQATPTYRDG
jgi:hypothetical protein